MPDPNKSGFTDNSLGAIAYITVVPAVFFLAISPYNKSASTPGSPQYSPLLRSSSSWS